MKNFKKNNSIIFLIILIIFASISIKNLAATTGMTGQLSPGGGISSSSGTSTVYPSGSVTIGTSTGVPAGVVPLNPAPPILPDPISPKPIAPAKPTGPTVPAEDEWFSARAADQAKIYGWGKPAWLKEINSPGWEDGAHIEQNGKTIYFVYTNADLFQNPVKERGPIRDTSNLCTHRLNPVPHACGKYPRADLFYSEFIGKTWGPVKVHPLTMKNPVGGFTLVKSQAAYVMTQFEDSQKEDIAYSKYVRGAWQDPIKIVAVSSPYSDSDPFVNQNDSEMFFTSDRPSTLGKGTHIYYSRKSWGKWQKPVLVPAPVNSGGNDIQPFLYKNILYFASDRDGVLKIYQAKRLRDLTFSTPSVVVESKYGVGEPTITADGKYLYFVQVFSKDGEYNPDIMFAKRGVEVSLSPGMFGAEVKTLQVRLKELNYAPKNFIATGYYGSMTKKAVSEFQKTNNLPATGIIDRITSSYINTGEARVEPTDSTKAGLAGYPDEPLVIVPIEPVSTRYLVEHRSALNGQTATLSGTVVSVVGNCTGNNLAGACPQPRIFVSAGTDEKRDKNYDVMILLGEESAYGVGQKIEIRGIVTGNKSVVFMTGN